MGIFIKNGKRGFQFLAVTIICLLFSISAVGAQSSGPAITITSPQNTTYTSTSIDLNVSADEAVDIWWYSWDGEGNVSGCRNCTSFNTTYGESVPEANTPLLLHFNENLGDTAFDDSGNDNDGALGNGTTGTKPNWTTGIFGPALHFDAGSDGYNDTIDISNSPSLNITQDLTVMYWFKVVGQNQESKPQYMIGQGDQGGDDYAWASVFKPATNSLVFWIKTLNVGGLGTSQQTPSNSIQYDNWYFVAYTYNSSSGNLTAYINGTWTTETTIGPGDIYQIAYNVQIGTRFNLGNRHFNGTIDEVQILDRVLTPSEIGDIYNKTLSEGLHNVTVYANDTAGNFNLTTRWFTVGTTPATITVCPSGCNYTSIQVAVDAANDRDTINVSAGTYYENVDINKSVSLVGAGADVTIVNASNSSDHVFEVTADGVDISWFTITNSNHSDVSGIYIKNKGHINLSNNVILHNGRLDDYSSGIYSMNSSNVQIINNNISGFDDGIYLNEFNLGLIYSNIIENNGFGLTLIDSFNNSVKNNSFKENVDDTAIQLLNSNSNNITQNYFINDEIRLHGSSNHVFENDFIGTGNFPAIELQTNFNNNLVYHNNFINVSKPEDYGTNNTWDSGYLGGGNYWSDWTSPDANGDGIVDLPYNISDGSNQDRYPFVNASGWVNQTNYPIITIYSPQNNSIFYEPDINIIGNTLSDEIIDYGCFGQSYGTVGGGGCGPLLNPAKNYSINSSVTLGPGLNTISFTYKDVLERSSSATLYFTYERPLVVNLSSACKGGKDYFSSIQAAIDNATDGDTIYVCNGTYNENVDVTKSVNLVGAGAGVTIVNAFNPSDHVIEVTANSVNISWFTVTGANGSGLLAGIYVNSADYTNISDNIAFNNTVGIYLTSSRNNYVQNNNASLNTYGIFLDELSLYTSNNIVINNIVDSNGGDGILLWYSSGNTIANNTVSDNYNGIYLSSSNSNTIKNNAVNSHIGKGIYLYSSNGNNIANNNASNNDHGIYLYGYCSDNILADNTVTLNSNSGIGLAYSNSNTITNNDIASNHYYGVYLHSSDGSNITNNNASNNQRGIYLSVSDNNTLFNNTANLNNFFGIYFINSNNNKAYNNLFNNSANVGFGGTIYINDWNTSKTSGTNVIGDSYLGGNFWAYPNGTGFSETCMDADSDGICDSSYTLASGNVDRLPLSLNFIMDTAPPLLSFDPSTPDDYYTSSSGNITIKILHNETNPDTLILNWNGTDEFYSYLSIDFPGGGAGGGPCGGIEQAPSYTTIWKTCLDEGIYTYYAWANDTAGNSNSTEIRRFIVSTTPDIKIEAILNELHDDPTPEDDYLRQALPADGVYALNSTAVLRFDGNADGDLRDTDDYDLYNAIVIIDQTGGDIQFAYNLSAAEHSTYSNSDGNIDAGEVVIIKGDNYIVTDNKTSDQDIELGPAIAKTLSATIVDKDNAVIISGTKKVLYGNDGHLYFYDGTSLLDSFNATGKTYPYKAVDDTDITSDEFRVYKVYVLSANSSEAKVTMVEKSQLLKITNDEEAVMGYSSVKVGDTDWIAGGEAGVFFLSDPITLSRGDTIDLSDTYYQLKYTTTKQFDIKRKKTASIASGAKLKSTTAPGEDFLVSGASITVSVLGADISIDFNSPELHDDSTAQDDYTQSTFAAAGYANASVNALNSSAVLKFDGNADGDLKDTEDYTLYNAIAIIDQLGGDIQFAYNLSEYSTYSNNDGNIDAGEVVKIKGDKYVITDNKTSDQDIELGPAIAKTLLATTVDKDNAVIISGTKKVLYGNDGHLYFYDGTSLLDAFNATGKSYYPYKAVDDIDILSDEFRIYKIYVLSADGSSAKVTMVEKSQLLKITNDEEGIMGYSSVKVSDSVWYDSGVFFLGEPITLIKGDTIDLSDTYYSLEYTAIKEFDILRKKTSAIASGTKLKDTMSPGKDFLKEDIIVYAVIAPSDTTKPIITLTSPQNTSYSSTNISLDVFADETIDTWIYNLNSVGNTTFTPNTTITGEEGLNSIVIYASDTAGNVDSVTVYFTIDTTPPTITIYSPTNTTYTTNYIDLNVSADEAVDAWWYSLDAAANVTFVPNTTLSSLGDGQHKIIVYANDSAGNVGSDGFETEVSEIWNRTYDVGSNRDSAHDIDVDSSGNVYVTGSSNLSGNYDYHTVKYDSSGNLLWNVTYDGGNRDIARGIVVDNSGNVYVTGYSNLGGNDESYTIKYDSSGNELWNLTHEDMDHAWDIAIDISGNIYVMGWSSGYYTIKYDSSGNELLNISTVTPELFDNPKGIAVSTEGDIYVTGQSYYNDFYTIKYDSSGNQLWNHTYDAGIHDSANDVAVDKLGNAYVTGFSWLNGTTGYHTIKYDSSGNLLWNRTYYGGIEDSSNSIAVDRSGNIYVTGYTWNGDNYDHHTIKYDSNGNELWNLTYDSGISDYAYGIAVDGEANIYIAGYSYDNGLSDYYTVKYSQRTEPVYFTIDTTQTSPPSCCGGGGGGGPGKGMGVIIKKIMGGEGGVAHFDPSESPISEITIKTKNTVYNIKITVEEFNEKPRRAMPDPPGRAFKYMKITKSKVSDSDIKEVEIKFQVDIEWLIESDTDPDTIGLYRYKNGKWEELDTDLLEADSKHAYFSAMTPGFSHFSITGKPGSGYQPQDTLPKEPVVTSPPVEIPGPIENADSTLEEMRKQTTLLKKQLEEMERQSRMIETVSRVVEGIENMLKTILNFFGMGKS